MGEIAVILPAAGRSSRFSGKEKKPFANLDGRAVWLRAAEQFVTRPDVGQTLIVISPDDEEMFKRRYSANLAFMDIELAFGGEHRFHSVGNALAKLKPDIRFVAIHDAVRPCVTEEMIDRVFAQAQKSGAAILAAPVTDTVKKTDANQQIKETIPRERLWLAQTPQVFRRDWLEEAYANRENLGSEITDDAQLVEALGKTVSIVASDATNVKITTKADLLLAEAVLKSRPKPKPTGPAHPFAEDQMW